MDILWRVSYWQWHKSGRVPSTRSKQLHPLAGHHSRLLGRYNSKQFDCCVHITQLYVAHRHRKGGMRQRGLCLPSKFLRYNCISLPKFPGHPLKPNIFLCHVASCRAHLIVIFQRVVYDWPIPLMSPVLPSTLLVDWRFTVKESGAQYVMTTSVLPLLMSPAGNWAFPHSPISAS